MAPVIVTVHVGLPFCVKFIAGPYLSPARPQPSAARHFTTGPSPSGDSDSEANDYYLIVICICTGTPTSRDLF